MNHNLRIRLAGHTDTDGIVRCRTVPLRERLLRLLLGEQRKLTILIPGDSVETLEIQETQGGGHEQA